MEGASAPEPTPATVPETEPVLDASYRASYPSPQPTLSELGEAIRRGWKVDPVRKAKYFAAMDELIEQRGEIEDPARRAHVVIGANRVYQQEQDAALRDLQQREKDARLDDGKATERTAVEPVICEEAIRPPPPTKPQ